MTVNEANNNMDFKELWGRLKRSRHLKYLELCLAHGKNQYKLLI